MTIYQNGRIWVFRFVTFVFTWNLIWETGKSVISTMKTELRLNIWTILRLYPFLTLLGYLGSQKCSKLKVLVFKKAKNQNSQKTPTFASLNGSKLEFSQFCRVHFLYVEKLVTLIDRCLEFEFFRLFLTLSTFHISWLFTFLLQRTNNLQGTYRGCVL